MKLDRQLHFSARARSFGVLALSTLVAAALPQASEAAYPRAAAAQHGMVVSAEQQASRVGADILRSGGNCVDAAVAVAFALAVVHPEAGNLGGGGFMLIHRPGGKNVAIDFRETAPARATRDMYLNRRGQIIPAASTFGYSAVGVPGTVAGMAMAERLYGRIGWKKVIEPARQLAIHGGIVSFSTADSLADPDARRGLSHFAASRAIFYPNRHTFREGERLPMSDLALTLHRLQKYGPGDFYHGQIARLIARDMARHGGLISLKDLSGYRARLRQPVEGLYRGYTVVSMPPPSSGGVALVEMLNMLSRYDLKSCGFGSAAYIHLVVECMRRAFADRSKYLGDPDFNRIPVASLISQRYADSRSRSIQLTRATSSEETPPGDPEVEQAQTTHFSVVDAEGGAVACTYTLNGLFGSYATVPGTGILLNNEMDDFTSAPGKPNMFGLIQGEKNAIAPGKRPLSSMTPTFVLRNGQLALVTGSPGGPTIINIVLEIILNVVDFGMDAEAATAAPRFHHQWQPDEIRLEPEGFSPDTIEKLRAMGHKIGRPRRMGDAATIAVDPVTHVRYGGADPRWSGAAVGY